jgi:circadian clock protein KaiB
MQPPTSDLFKGIALFTPGGDLVYCIDPHKQNRWHLQLCVFLQELLGLSEPPHFLIPCFTATIDHWRDPRSQTLTTFAEIYPFVWRYRSLLTALFGCSELDWQLTHHTLCDPVMMAAYRQQFPQLWQNHNLVARLDPIQPLSPLQVRSATPIWFAEFPQQAESRQQTESDMGTDIRAGDEENLAGYVFRLFVAGNSAVVEQILQTLHQLLEENLRQPYTLKIIDVRKHPEQAEADQITATPTLVKAWPTPVRRIVGELDNPDQLLQLLR